MAKQQKDEGHSCYFFGTGCSREIKDFEFRTISISVIYTHMHIITYMYIYTYGYMYLFMYMLHLHTVYTTKLILIYLVLFCNVCELCAFYNHVKSKIVKFILF